MIPTLIALGLAAATIAALAWRWRAAAPRWSGPDRLTAGLLAAAVVTAWLVVVTSVLGMLDSNWNAARLAPSFGLLYGYHLYYPATEGPILNHVCGPVSALAFLPAAIFRTPTPAILAGGALEVAFIFAPLLWFVWRAGGRAPAERALALACGLAACLLMTRYRATLYWITLLHADGPALALGMLACAALVTRPGAEPTTRALAASATAAVLAPWAKQVEAPVAAALVLGLWILHGRALALRYVAMLAGIGLLVSGAFVAWFGDPLLFNMFRLLNQHPWYTPGITGLLGMLGSLLWDVRGLLALLGIALAVGLLAPVERGRRTGPWLLPLLAAVCLLPTGALSANKVGGEPYALHSASYLLAAVAALLLDAARRAPATRALAWGFCAIAIAAAWQSGRPLAWAPRPPLWQNDNQLAYEFALRHPGEAYFPWQPLASLLAEGRLYHFEYGMMDRLIGGYAPTPEHVRAELPPQLRWIAAHTRVWTFTNFPDYGVSTTLPELPGWTVRARATDRPAS